jgi:hypothetical protein
MHRFSIIAAILLFVAIGAGSAGSGDKESLWKPFMPEDIKGVLEMRSRAKIMEANKAGNKTKAEVEETLIAAYALSVQTKDAGKKPDAAAEIAKLKTKMIRKEIFSGMMDLYAGKEKKGDGIHTALQYQPKLKNLNSVEALIGSLARKKLTDENLAMVAEELPRLSNWIAVTANLTRLAPPSEMADRWEALAIEMRNSALALAESSRQKDAEGILKAAGTLQDTCTICHRKFKPAK